MLKASTEKYFQHGISDYLINARTMGSTRMFKLNICGVETKGAEKENIMHIVLHIHSVTKEDLLACCVCFE